MTKFPIWLEKLIKVTSTLAIKFLFTKIWIPNSFINRHSCLSLCYFDSLRDRKRFRYNSAFGCTVYILKSHGVRTLCKHINQYSNKGFRRLWVLVVLIHIWIIRISLEIGDVMESLALYWHRSIIHTKQKKEQFRHTVAPLLWALPSNPGSSCC